MIISGATEVSNKKAPRTTPRESQTIVLPASKNAPFTSLSPDEWASERLEDSQPRASTPNQATASSNRITPIFPARNISGSLQSVWENREALVPRSQQQSVLNVASGSFGKRRRSKDQSKQVSSVASLTTESSSKNINSRLQEQTEKQQASKICQHLRYVSNYCRALQNYLPTSGLRQIQACAEEWPALGNSFTVAQRRAEELESYKPTVPISRYRNKTRFWDFHASSSLRLRQDPQLVQRQNLRHVAKEGAVNGKVVENKVHEPKLMMLNNDFAVTSSLRDNLLITIALTERECSTQFVEDQEELKLGLKEQAHLVLLGRFTAFSSFLQFKLCHDALRVKYEQNAGGSSTISESLSVEYFARRFRAQDIVSEMEVEYWSSNWKKVDYICTLYGQRVGVSVSRAMAFPDPKAFSPEMAHRLLHKKLYGLVVARDGVTKRHSFSKSILHVWCETQRTAEIMRTVSTDVRKDLNISDSIIMVLTVADDLYSRPIFYEHALHQS
ncbi:uncharacterized protein [Physcomitrium patens]|uniref:Uncharacterized protein n=1 Tax=Physcomitrium patens TaxID=3218 RepID=A0A2K1IFG6_PHYPA|nr:uncharacterized protein LOC112277051 [Physcomitrium patens]XP_024364791.1 uncharacterized protein LOC112277051 [Physcomitrium patens]XP_024364793.1 uncharacterized protein LOC112277051 [Physcomitrium patens]PNR28021.1 hypothetical protein PHYPA_028613 [Physcomitrium patens]|eukprot:XP_024364790.1 uncharacterized protein LOC112277051 [Physcomitrella patens]